jgi:hypothetical protein
VRGGLFVERVIYRYTVSKSNTTIHIMVNTPEDGPVTILPVNMRHGLIVCFSLSVLTSPLGSECM